MSDSNVPAAGLDLGTMFLQSARDEDGAIVYNTVRDCFREIVYDPEFEDVLLNGNPAARHIVLDPNQTRRFSDCGLQFLEEAGVRHLVEHHIEESQIALPGFLKEGRGFDLGFIDGNHHFERVFLDLFYLGYLVREGGIIILDDYSFPAIKRAVSFYVTNLNWKIEETNVGGHQVVLRTAQDADNRGSFIEF